MADHVEQLKKQVCEAIDRRAAELIETADWIHAHPEIGHQEVEASRRLAGLLEAAGISVEMGTAGMPTAFKAELRGTTVGDASASSTSARSAAPSADQSSRPSGGSAK